MAVNGPEEATSPTTVASGGPDGNLRLGAPVRKMELQMDDRQTAIQPRVTRRRGRPPKYGRPARLVAVTLPHDVVDWLASVDPDVGRAIVELHDRTTRRDPRARRPEPPGAELVDVGEGRSLIVVDPKMVRGLAGVAAIPFGEGRSFLALEPFWTMADLELSLVDALDRGVADAARRAALVQFRDQLREWRKDRSVVLEPRAIIVAGRRPKARTPMGGSGASS